MMAWPGLLLLLVGVLLLVIAAWGVLTLPDALSRQHAATKAGTLALTSICLGAALLAQDWQWVWRLLLIVIFLLFTLPVASHLLARAAIQTRAMRNGQIPAESNAADGSPLADAWQAASDAASLSPPPCAKAAVKPDQG